MNKVDEKLLKLKNSLEELESRIQGLLEGKGPDEKIERVQKHKRAMQEIQDYYKEKVS